MIFCLEKKNQMKNNIDQKFKCLLAYQVVLPTLNGSLSCIEYHKGLPILSPNFNEGFLRFLLIDKLLLTFNGFSSLKYFNHKLSNKIPTKNPTQTIGMVNKIQFSLNNINGSNNRELKNLVNLTFGKFLAYFSNCADVKFHDFGNLAGNSVQILSLKLSKVKSTIADIGGYTSIKVIYQAFGLEDLKAWILAIIIVTNNLGNIANKPENFITIALLKNFLNIITPFNLMLLNISQPQLTLKICNSKGLAYV